MLSIKYLKKALHVKELIELLFIYVATVRLRTSWSLLPAKHSSGQDLLAYQGKR